MQNIGQNKKILKNQQYKNGKKIMATKCFDSIIMLRFGKTKVAKKNFIVQKTIENL